MPWSIEKRDEQFCVIKDDGTVEGCHDSRNDALAQQRALYASDRKGRWEKTVFSGEIASFNDYDRAVEAAKEREQVGNLLFVYEALAENIIFDPEMDMKAKISAFSDLSREMENRMESLSEEKTKSGPVTRAIDAIRGLFKQSGSSMMELGSNESASTMVYKDQNGELQWVTRFSNNFRDDDNPPEIISSESHEKFVALVNSGVVPPPDLWLWHEEDWRWGKGKWVAYDDSGFALAGGSVIPEFAELAEILSKAGDAFATSHGMPVWSISRDKDDSSIITEHITEEVSPLPAWAAANKLTSNEFARKENNMLSKDEKARLMSEHGVSPELLRKLEEFNVGDAQKALLDGRERKSADGEDPTPATDPEVPEAPEDGTGDDPDTADAEDGQREPDLEVSNAEVVGALKSVIESVAALNAKHESLVAEVKSLKEADSEKIAKKASGTTIASLADMLATSVVGNSEARVDGRKSLAKSGPEETEHEVPQHTPFPFVNELLARQNGEGGGA